MIHFPQLRKNPVEKLLEKILLKEECLPSLCWKVPLTKQSELATLKNIIEKYSWRDMLPLQRKLSSLLGHYKSRYQTKGFCDFSSFLARCTYYGWRCFYCSIKVDQGTVTIQHRLNASRGGTNWPANLVPACFKCNILERKNCHPKINQN